ncbi:MAG: preprotein translocase subunit SecE, partial [Bacteroidota bacterium]
CEIPFSVHINGCSSVGRALVSKTRCREFESLLPCKGSALAPLLKKKMITYIKASLEELKNNVSWPSREQASNLMVVVAVFSLIFALMTWGIDTVFSRLIQVYFDLLK